MSKSKYFKFVGSADSYWSHAIGACFLTVFTAGIAFPWAVCMMQRWKARYTIIGGRQLIFIGKGSNLFGQWLKWTLLIFLTLGIYTLWVLPKLNKWIVEHTDFAIDPHPIKPKVEHPKPEMAI